MPGALPVLNKAAIRMAVKTAVALDCEINETNVFSRKHYFYPDLPKGYQISQYDRPYAVNGKVPFYLDGELKTVRLHRIHMEEDAGKNLHFDDRGISLVDLNRSSVPLIEIVTEPDIRSAAEAVAYLKQLRRVLRYLDVCEGNLEEGNFRCDANVSIRPWGQKEFGTRVELKNINSFRNIEKAVLYEIERQYHDIEAGEKVVQETRLWDANENKSHSMRSKEEASDYRYMPEPDLMPLTISDKFVNEVKSELPELPINKMNRFIEEFGLSPYDAEVLTASTALAAYYEEVANTVGDHKMASNFIQTNVLAHIKDVERDFETFYPDAKALSELLLKIKDNTISLNIAKEVIEIMMAEKKPAGKIIEEKGMAQVTDLSALQKIVDDVIANSPGQLEQYKAGKEKLFGYFMGQCQKALKGKGDPKQLNEMLRKALK
jgi:aspartyl-tRNA(Asn)/glutamyl-tRNA(Gln) amidotransferase subunit B